MTLLIACFDTECANYKIVIFFKIYQCYSERYVVIEFSMFGKWQIIVLLKSGIRNSKKKSDIFEPNVSFFKEKGKPERIDHVRKKMPTHKLNITKTLDISHTVFFQSNHCYEISLA